MYSVALTLTSAAWVLPQGLQTVLFPRVASLDESTLAGGDQCRRVGRGAGEGGSAWRAADAPGGAVDQHFAARRGAAALRREASTTRRNLASSCSPGVLLLGIGKILSSAIAGLGYPRYALWIAAVVMPVTLVLYFTLIPSLAAWGAAIASSVSYALTAVLTLVFLPASDAHSSPRGPRAARRGRRGLRRALPNREVLAARTMSPRTVLVLPAWYPTARQPLSGPFVRDHARAAAALGHHVVVIVDEGSRPDIRGLFKLSEERGDGLRIVRLTYRPRTGTIAYLPAVLVVARRLSREGTRVDVLHAHIHWMGWPAMLVGALLRRPFLITENSSEWPRRTIRPGALRRARLTFRRAALVTPVNKRLQQAIEQYGVRANFRVVPNTIDTGVFRPTSNLRAKAPSRLVNVALHVEVKALDVLLRSFAGTCVA